MKTYGGADAYIRIFLTSALVGDEWSVSRPGRFTPGERGLVAHWIGGSVGSKANLDDVDKIRFLTLSGLEIRSLGRPARTQSLYRLRYPGSLLTHNIWKLVYNVKLTKCFKSWSVFGRSFNAWEYSALCRLFCNEVKWKYIS
jgi:hypothetical protein